MVVTMKRRRNKFRIKEKKKIRSGRDGLQFYRKKAAINVGLVKEGMIWAVEIILVVVIAAFLAFYLGFRVPVIGQSMSGTLENGEQVLVNRFVYNLFQPKANDIIVFLPNGNEKSHYYIKRVIAVPGDKVQIIDGKVYVNGEPFLEEIEEPIIDNALLAEEEITVQEDEFFVLGDNRNNSEDSRYANIGNVKKEYIEGKAWFIVSPFDRLGFIK